MIELYFIGLNFVYTIISTNIFNEQNHGGLSVSGGDTIFTQKDPLHQLSYGSLLLHSLDHVLLADVTDLFRRLDAGGRLPPLKPILHVVGDGLNPAVRVLGAGAQEVHPVPGLALHTYLGVLPDHPRAAGAQLDRPPGLLPPPAQDRYPSEYNLENLLKQLGH